MRRKNSSDNQHIAPILIFVMIVKNSFGYSKKREEFCQNTGEMILKRKHALIITAYQEIDFLRKLCERYAQYFYCYIHIDKKYKGSSSEIEELKRIKNVFVLSEYRINWGSYKHILAILELLQKAKNDGMDYFHIVAANTILVKNPQKLFDFIENDPNKIYMEVKTRESGGFYEFEYRYSAYFFEHIYDLKGRRGRIWARVEKYSSMFQRKLKLRKKVEMDYKGYIYCHLPKAAVDYVLQYVEKNPQYLKTLKYCYVSEEFFFQNILMKSIFCQNVVNDTLIYDEWGERGYPAFLDVTDISAIEESNCFFARKVSEKQRPLFEMLCQKEKW